MVLPTDIRYGSSSMIPWQHTKLYKWIPLQLSPSRYIYICNVEVCLHTVTFNTSSQIFEGGWFPCARRTAARSLQFITTFIAHGAYSVACNLVQSIDCIPTASTCMNNSHSNWNWRNCDVKRSFYLLPVFTRLCKLIRYFYNESYQIFLQRKSRNRLCRTSVVIKLLLILLHSALWN